MLGLCFRDVAVVVGLEGGGGREAYDGADNKWALYSDQGLPQLLQPPLPLEVVCVGEESTKAQAKEHDR